MLNIIADFLINTLYYLRSLTDIFDKFSDIKLATKNNMAYKSVIAKQKNVSS